MPSWKPTALGLGVLVLVLCVFNFKSVSTAPFVTGEVFIGGNNKSSNIVPKVEEAVEIEDGPATRDAQMGGSLLDFGPRPASPVTYVVKANEAKWRDVFAMEPGEVPGRLSEDVVKTSPPLNMKDMSPDVQLYDAPQRVVIPTPARRHLDPIYCVLATPKLVYTRLLPLLTTSLADAPLVYVFFRKTNISYTAVAAVERGLQSAEGQGYRSNRVRVVELDGPNGKFINVAAFIRNSWMDMEIVAFLGREYLGPMPPTPLDVVPADTMSKWFTVIDDDSYVLTPATTAALHSATQLVLKNQSLPPAPNTMVPIMVGKLLIHQKKGIRKIQTGRHVVTKPRSSAPPDRFAAGGGGISFNIGALAAMYSTRTYYACIAKYKQGGGDIRLSKCLVNEGGAHFVENSCFSWDTPMRALGEQRLDKIAPFPCSFHRMRNTHWYYMLGAVERARAAQDGSTGGRRRLLTWWDDLKINFKEGPTVWKSHFFPRRYDNFSEIYFALSKTDLIRLNKKRGTPLTADP